MLVPLHHRRGQSLILVVVLIGGIMMIVTAVSGLLSFYKLQEAGDAGRSTEAILAADAGLEKTLRYYKTTSGLPENCTFGVPCSPPVLQEDMAESGARFVGEILVRQPDPFLPDIVVTLSATGFDSARRTIRTLQTTFLSQQ